jgi:hypothetical protein
MLFAWLKPLTLDEHDFVSFVMQCE